MTLMFKHYLQVQVFLQILINNVRLRVKIL
jgi:hypothetical protein